MYLFVIQLIFQGGHIVLAHRLNIAFPDLHRRIHALDILRDVGLALPELQIGCFLQLLGFRQGLLLIVAHTLAISAQGRT